MYIPGVDKLIGRLEDVIAKEVFLVKFKGELEAMQVFLRDADQAQFTKEADKKWMTDVRDKAYEAQDIIDEFTYHMTKHQQDQISCFSWFLHLLIDAPKTIWVMHQTAHKLQKIKKRIQDIVERHTRYKSGPPKEDIVETHLRYRQLEQQVRNLRDAAFFIEANSTVGFHRQTESLKKWLTDSQPLRVVIIVFGMGGAGKTTLLANIFKKERGGFGISTWITISQTYTSTELFKSLIETIDNVNVEEMKKKSYIQLGEMLRDLLNAKRYLIVLNDLWDTILWEEMKVALSENKLGSRILLITRDIRNAPSPSDVNSYKLPIGKLEGKEPWILFSMKAFVDHPNKTCLPELDSLAQKLVEKCGGLLLALVTLGGHMSSKMREQEWIDIYDNLYKNADMNIVKNILMLSFSDLPYSLKQCFLYCCIFPEDFHIKRKRLLRRWMGEGFVVGGDKITPEKEADSYLSELVFRSMLLVEEINESGRPKVVKMHDVMRGFALKITREEKFCGVFDGKEDIDEIGAYHLSIHPSDNDYSQLKFHKDNSRVRSLFLFTNKPLPI